MNGRSSSYPPPPRAATDRYPFRGHKRCSDWITPVSARDDLRRVLAGPHMVDEMEGVLVVEPLQFLAVQTFTHPVTGDRSDYVAGVVDSVHGKAA